MELKDTISMMESSNYKERFKAEYYQTLIRFDKLTRMVNKYEKDELDFTPACSISVLRDQLNAMETYLAVLEYRAHIEKIELPY